MGHETHESRTVTWLGTDDPQRADTATINLEPERLSAHGASRTAGYAASWALTTTGNWFTENLTVSVHGRGWSRYLVLDRATDGSWRAATKVSGDTDLPDPGIVDPASLTGAVDCDLGLCPATNTMPILRLGLVHDAEAAAELTVAWVEMPSLRVLGRQQIYSGSRAYDDGTGTAAVTYSSGDFSAEVVVDSDGIVIDYPGLATRRRD
jgi:uncharacterized protein